jgi:hypothetical protein
MLSCCSFSPISPRTTQQPGTSLGPLSRPHLRSVLPPDRQSLSAASVRSHTYHTLHIAQQPSYDHTSTFKHNTSTSTIIPNLATSTLDLNLGIALQITPRPKPELIRPRPILCIDQRSRPTTNDIGAARWLHKYGIPFLAGRDRKGVNLDVDRDRREREGG